MDRSPNIVLVGFMGTGKTSVGKAVANHLSFRFLDMDDIIVAQTGKPIPRIFEEDGEQHFRNMEYGIAKKLSTQTGIVIATGGGVVLNSDNIRNFSKTGIVICLSATPETIIERVQHDTNRPLLNVGDKMSKITEMLKSRKHLYDAIPHQLDTTNLSENEVLEKIVALYNDFRNADIS